MRMFADSVARLKVRREQGAAVLIAVLGLALCGAAMGAQQIELDGTAAPTVGSTNRAVQADAVRKNHVSLVSDGAEVEAGKPEVLEVVFRVDPGFHINSHTPKDDLLIPTVFQLQPEGVKVLSETYPSGSEFRLSLPGTASPGETLDVYQGEFRVSLRIIAPKGASRLAGSLHYQACDNAACFPPRTLAITVALMGR